MSYNHDIQDPTFVADLERSKIAVNKAASIFSNRGFPVVVAPTFIRPDVSKRAEYADDGDLQILVTCEVKHRPNLSFTSRKDFKYKTAIVDSCQKFDKKKQIPFWYIIWNSNYTAYIFVDVHKTKSKWKRVERYDRAKDRKEYFYEIDTSMCVFMQI